MHSVSKKKTKDLSVVRSRTPIAEDGMREARRTDSGAPDRALVRGHTLGPGGAKEGRDSHRRGG